MRDTFAVRYDMGDEYMAAARALVIVRPGRDCRRPGDWRLYRPGESLSRRFRGKLVQDTLQSPAKLDRANLTVPIRDQGVLVQRNPAKDRLLIGWRQLTRYQPRHGPDGDSRGVGNGHSGPMASVTFGILIFVRLERA